MCHKASEKFAQIVCFFFWPPTVDGGTNVIKLFVHGHCKNRLREKLIVLLDASRTSLILRSSKTVCIIEFSESGYTFVSIFKLI